MTHNKPNDDRKWYEIKSRRSFSPKPQGNLKKEHFEIPKSERRKDGEVKQLRGSKPHPSAKRSPDRRRDSIAVKSLDSLFQFSGIPKDARSILTDFQSVILSSHPLSSRQRQLLPQQIKELSHFLTDERSSRRMGYMNQTTTLSAYVHYYLWWNLVRLTRLFANLPADFFALPQNAVCTDIGSGPLTVPIAIMPARPELRKKSLTWYCMDLSTQALGFGEDIFLSTAARLECSGWKIVKVKGEFGTGIKEKAHLVTCANVFNEFTEDAGMPPDYLAKKHCEKLLTYTDSGRILIVEPGVPKTARFVSLMRDALMRRNYMPLSPCTHCADCPMDGKRGGKWCNFAFSTEDAPAELRKLSERAQLPKERAVLSFVAAAYQSSTQSAKQGVAYPSSTQSTEQATAYPSSSHSAKQASPSKTFPQSSDSVLTFRIASDSIRLPGYRCGWYACSELGLLLVVTETELKSGESYSIEKKDLPQNLPIDEKSGAKILELD